MCNKNCCSNKISRRIAQVEVIFGGTGSDLTDDTNDFLADLPQSAEVKSVNVSQDNDGDFMAVILYEVDNDEA